MSGNSDETNITLIQIPSIKNKVKFQMNYCLFDKTTTLKI